MHEDECETDVRSRIDQDVRTGYWVVGRRSVASLRCRRSVSALGGLIREPHRDSADGDSPLGCSDRRLALFWRLRWIVGSAGNAEVPADLLDHFRGHDIIGERLPR